MNSKSSRFSFLLPSPISCGRGGRGEGGFTLLELLIVIFIIAIIVSVATLALGDMGKNRKAGYFAQQLKSTLAYAQQYAVIQPTTVIFEVENNHYQFKTLQMIADDKGSIHYRWNILNTPGNPNNNLPDYITLKIDNPIQINSNGTITPFSMHIGVLDEDSYYVLNGNAAGTLSLEKQSGDNS